MKKQNKGDETKYGIMASGKKVNGRVALGKEDMMKITNTIKKRRHTKQMERNAK